jgi:hypothetical protein
MIAGGGLSIFSSGGHVATLAMVCSSHCKPAGGPGSGEWAGGLVHNTPPAAAVTPVLGHLGPVPASWRHSGGHLVTRLPLGGVGLASPFRRRAEYLWDFEEALLSPAATGKGEFLLK